MHEMVLVKFIAAMDQYMGWLICPSCADPDESPGHYAGELGTRCGRCGRRLKMAPGEVGQE